MEDRHLTKLKEWFSLYITRFSSKKPDIRDAIERKIMHTALVCDNIKLICSSEENQPNTFLAEAAALFHDIGRFPQLDRFGTFVDFKSLDHGTLAVDILLDENVLSGISGSEQRCIFTAVKWHNKKDIPNDLQEDELFLLKLLRDADKLDILRMFSEYYPISKTRPNELLEFGLPESDKCEDGIINAILDRRIADIMLSKSLNDIRLSKLSWFYDFNFPKSRRLFKERQYLDHTLAVLPDIPDVRKVAERIKKDMDNI